VGAPSRVKITTWNNSLKGDGVKLYNHVFNVKPKQIKVKVTIYTKFKGLG
jgi:hypothetical protein